MGDGGAVGVVEVEGSRTEEETARRGHPPTREFRDDPEGMHASIMRGSVEAPGPDRHCQHYLIIGTMDTTE